MIVQMSNSVEVSDDPATGYCDFSWLEVCTVLSISDGACRQPRDWELNCCDDPNECCDGLYGGHCLRDGQALLQSLRPELEVV